MKVFVLNCGSSSIKYQLLSMPSEDVLAKGLVEKIGIAGSRVKHKNNDDPEIGIDADIPDHTAGIKVVFELLTNKKNGILKDVNDIDAVGHRVVHGGEDFSGSVPITPAVIKAMEKNIDLAPLHNPPNLAGIYRHSKIASKGSAGWGFRYGFSSNHAPLCFPVCTALPALRKL